MDPMGCKMEWKLDHCLEYEKFSEPSQTGHKELPGQFFFKHFFQVEINQVSNFYNVEKWLVKG